MAQPAGQSGTLTYLTADCASRRGTSRSSASPPASRSGGAAARPSLADRGNRPVDRPQMAERPALVDGAKASGILLEGLGPAAPSPSASASMWSPIREDTPYPAAASRCLRAASIVAGQLFSKHLARALSERTRALRDGRVRRCGAALARPCCASRRDDQFVSLAATAHEPGRFDGISTRTVGSILDNGSARRCGSTQATSFRSTRVRTRPKSDTCWILARRPNEPGRARPFRMAMCLNGQEFNDRMTDGQLQQRPVPLSCRSAASGRSA